MVCKNCHLGDISNVPILVLNANPNTNDEINKLFLKLYHSLKIDEESLLLASKELSI